MCIRQNVSIKHVNVPIDQISWHKIKILWYNRAIFIQLDFVIRFNIDITVILKKVACEVYVHVRFLCILEFWKSSKTWRKANLYLLKITSTTIGHRPPSAASSTTSRQRSFQGVSMHDNATDSRKSLAKTSSSQRANWYTNHLV